MQPDRHAFMTRVDNCGNIDSPHLHQRIHQQTGQQRGGAYAQQIQPHAALVPAE
ncbi:MAG: hypothetical protein HZT40_00025 [Candidatus Thiothrix singaporensis]|uniref:Uncharacterized protein n=1 Tax=Candidatus Thiothrix singaporensis TaxID=2799669 RepID=A0A7L6AMB8_9GAMM|nr:MAG: hypothetical protein HZT40_00025 [Candidatus Thiothrix singaporensis]